MEFVVVRCSDDGDRSVLIDGVRSGRTGQTLQVQKGNHSFALCECDEGDHVKYCRAARYLPIRQLAQVKDTVSLRPLEVLFARQDD